MKQAKSRSPHQITGRAILMGLLSMLVLEIMSVAIVGLVGSPAQFAHTQAILPILIQLVNPVMAAAITYYLTRKR
jgi:hypothetical protein